MYSFTAALLRSGLWNEKSVLKLYTCDRNQSLSLKVHPARWRTRVSMIHACRGQLFIKEQHPYINGLYSAPSAWPESWVPCMHVLAGFPPVQWNRTHGSR